MRFITSLVLVLFSGLIAPSVIAQEELDREELESNIATLEQDIAEIQLLGAHLDQTEGQDLGPLMFRYDERALRILQSADDIAVQVADLPEDDALVVILRTRVLKDFDVIGDSVFDRLAELDQVIAGLREEKDGQSGRDRIETQARLDGLDHLRERYVFAMGRHLGARFALGLDNSGLRPRVVTRITLRAEALSGEISAWAREIDELNASQQTSRNDPDIAAVIAHAQGRQGRALDRLSSVVAIMDALELPTDSYKSLLLAERQGFSTQVFNFGVLSRLVVDWTHAAQEWLMVKGVDLFFSIVLFVLILLIVRYLARIAQFMARKGLERSNQDLSVLLRNTLISLAGGLVLIAGFLFALSQFGISIGPLLAGLGIAGFVIGFALQDTLANFAAGGMILLYRPYDVDDFVEVQGASGVVKDMNLVSTTIATFDNQTLVVPNSKIWGDVIRNVTAQTIRRVDLEFGIGYDDDIEHAERVLAEAAADHPLTLDEPEPLIKVHTLGDSSVNLILRPWAKTDDYWTVYWDLMRDVKMRFDREGISIPFPQRDVHLYPASEASDSKES